MPKEGEPGTLKDLFDKNAVPEAGRLKRKTLPPSEDSDEEDTVHMIAFKGRYAYEAVKK